MTLIDRQIAGREIPLAAILRIAVDRLTPARPRGNRTVRYGLTFDVSPRARDRVVAAEIEARAGAILRLQTEAGVLPIQQSLVIVLEQRQVVGASSHAGRRERARIDRLPGRRVGALHVEAAVIAIDEVGAHGRAAAEL